MLPEIDNGGLLKWTEEDYMWSAGAPQPVNVCDIDFEAEKCMWCGGDVDGQILETYTHESNSTYFTGLRQCRLCGWFLERSGWYNHSAHCRELRGYFSLLRKFSLNDEEVTIQELGTYLRTHFSDIYNIPPRRVEELIADIFKSSLGYRVRLTQQTRDGGADIFLLDDGGNHQAIVEVKRYNPGYRVGIQLVRQLLGAQIILKARKSYLVTTSSFTNEALRVPNLPHLQKCNLEVDLWDGLRLLKELSCYNEQILPIDSIKLDIPLCEQLPQELRAKKRLVRAPWKGFYGKRVSYVEGMNQPE